MKILNLYAGIGGNRKLWGDTHDITAVEFRDDIAAIYKDFFPNDNVIVGDAHEYLLRHYKEFDFIALVFLLCNLHLAVIGLRRKGFSVKNPAIKN